MHTKWMTNYSSISHKFVIDSAYAEVWDALLSAHADQLRGWPALLSHSAFGKA